MAKKDSAIKTLDLPEKLERETFGLDGKKAIAIEGESRAWEITLISASVFYWTLLIGIAVGTWLSGTYDRSTTAIFYAVGGVLVAATLGFVVYKSVLRNGRKRAILNGTVTLATIINVSRTVDYRYNGSGNNDDESRRKYTTVSVTYSYINDGGKQAAGIYKKEYSGDGPLFYDGQQLTVAIVKSGEIYILKKYTLIPEDEERLFELDDRRKKELYENLDPRKAKPRSGTVLVPFSQGFLLAGVYLALGGLTAAFAVFGCARVVWTAAEWEAWLKIVFSLLFFAAPVVLLSIGLSALFTELAARRKFNAALSSCEHYAKGTLFCGVRTYGKEDARRCYCAYLDADGKPQTIVAPKAVAAKKIRLGKPEVTVLCSPYGAVLADTVKEKKKSA